MKNRILLILGITFFITSTYFGAIKDEPFTQEYHKPYPLQSKEENDVRAIAVDLSGVVWAGTKAGLFKLDKSTNVWKVTP